MSPDDARWAGSSEPLVDLSRKEAFQASDDLAFGPAIAGASGDVVAGWLVESHADDDGSIEGGVGRARICPSIGQPNGAESLDNLVIARGANVRRHAVRHEQLR